MQIDKECMTDDRWKKEVEEMGNKLIGETVLVVQWIDQEVRQKLRRLELPCDHVTYTGLDYSEYCKTQCNKIRQYLYLYDLVLTDDLTPAEI